MDLIKIELHTFYEMKCNIIVVSHNLLVMNFTGALKKKPTINKPREIFFVGVF